MLKGTANKKRNRTYKQEIRVKRGSRGNKK
jgi:hypothetical protein